MACAAWLGGCQGSGAIGSGEGLFHDLEGGIVAEQRPPPPGVNDPWPSLGTVPKRPPAPDIVAEQKLGDQLAAQRDQATQSAAASPLVVRPAPAPAKPKPAAPPDPNANRVVVDAAPAPAPKPAAAAPPVAAPPVVAQPVAAQPAAPAIPSLASAPAVQPGVVSGPLPSLAAAAPPVPTGLGEFAAMPAPTAPPAAILPPAPAPSATSMVVEFTPGSAELPPSANLSLRRFALAHKGVGVTVTGHGDAVLQGPDSQSRALDLALRRAQAMAAALNTAGIPAANLHLRAESAGRGGVASI